MLKVKEGVKNKMTMEELENECTEIATQEEKKPGKIKRIWGIITEKPEQKEGEDMKKKHTLRNTLIGAGVAAAAVLGYKYFKGSNDEDIIDGDYEELDEDVEDDNEVTEE